MEGVICQIRDIWAIVKQVNFSCWRGRGNLKGFQKLGKFLTIVTQLNIQSTQILLLE